MAAASAASRGRRVLLLEKNKKLGVKILMSGGTRCNITHNCSIREIVSAFGKQGRFLHSALSALPPLDVIKKIEAQGVATKIESTGKIFPVSNKAIDVRDALVEIALQAGATIRNQHAVDDIQPIQSTGESDASNEPHRFLIHANGETYRSNSLIITTLSLIHI